MHRLIFEQSMNLDAGIYIALLKKPLNSGGTYGRALMGSNIIRDDHYENNSICLFIIEKYLNLDENISRRTLKKLSIRHHEEEDTSITLTNYDKINNILKCGHDYNKLAEIFPEYKIDIIAFVLSNPLEDTS